MPQTAYTAASPTPFISDGRFCIQHAPAGRPVRGCVLHVHAFAEEMNKSRRMVAIGARAMAEQGWAVLQLDLAGCGDSAQPLEQATWADWQADVDWGLQWLAERHGPLPRWLWGHRAGALLAAQAASSLPGTQLLLWQPVLQGRAVVQTLLRLKAAAQWDQGNGKAAMAQARADLDAGRALEVAGYTVDSALIRSLEEATLAPPQAGAEGARLVWLEVNSRAEAAGPSPAARTQHERWQAAGWAVTAHTVHGPLFWQTVEIEDAPELVAASLAALSGAAPA